MNLLYILILYSVNSVNCVSQIHMVEIVLKRVNLSLSLDRVGLGF